MSTVVSPSTASRTSLSTWVQHRLHAVLSARSEPELEEALSLFISRHCNITVNGAHLSRDQYKQQLRPEFFDDFSHHHGAIPEFDVKFNGCVSVPSSASDSAEEREAAGMIGIFYEATRNVDVGQWSGEKRQRRVISTLNLIVAPDRSQVVQGTLDSRRVKTMNQVFLEKSVWQHL